MQWPDLVFYVVLFLAIGGAFEGFKEVVKLFINRRYDAKIAASEAKRPPVDPK
jgi:hypothetical protein